MKPVFLLLASGVFLGALNTSAGAYGTWHESRFRNMIPQQYEMSCGAASLASLLNLYGAKPIGEEEVMQHLTILVSAADRDKTLENGFSLLDLKRVTQKYGLDLKAARINRDQLTRFNSPAILQLKTRFGYHFVLWHGYLNGRHWVGDPSRGEMWLNDGELENEWTGIAAWGFKSEGQPLPPANAQVRDAAYFDR